MAKRRTRRRGAHPSQAGPLPAAPASCVPPCELRIPLHPDPDAHLQAHTVNLGDVVFHMGDLHLGGALDAGGRHLGGSGAVARKHEPEEQPGGRRTGGAHAPSSRAAAARRAHRSCLQVATRWRRNPPPCWYAAMLCLPPSMLPASEHAHLRTLHLPPPPPPPRRPASHTHHEGV